MEVGTIMGFSRSLHDEFLTEYGAVEVLSSNT